MLTYSAKGWRLYAHLPNVHLVDVTWKVSEAGRQRVLREKRKNVHAFAIGTMVSILDIRDGVERRGVRYNPYEGPYFQIDGQPVTQSKQARFLENRKVLAFQA